MAQKILIIGSGSEGKSALMLQAMKEKYGEDIVLVTPEEAKELNLKPEDFGNIPSHKITSPPMLSYQPLGAEKTGKEKRRERRKQERQSKNKRK